jgi:hypothetical protein
MNVFNFIRDNFIIDNFIIDNFIDTFFFGESDLFYPGSFIEPPSKPEEPQEPEEPEEEDFIKSGSVSEDSEDWGEVWGEDCEIVV